MPENSRRGVAAVQRQIVAASRSMLGLPLSRPPPMTRIRGWDCRFGRALARPSYRCDAPAHHSPSLRRNAHGHGFHCSRYAKLNRKSTTRKAAYDARGTRRPRRPSAGKSQAVWPQPIFFLRGQESKRPQGPCQAHRLARNPNSHCTATSATRQRAAE